MNKKNYTKYAEVCVNEYGPDDIFLCGPMPVSARIAWRDVHNVAEDETAVETSNVSYDEEEEYEDNSYNVVVYSNMRGWRWNRKAIKQYFDEFYGGYYDVNFFLYHEYELRKIMGDKHFKDLLQELKIYKEFKEERQTYVRPGRIVSIESRISRTDNKDSTQRRVRRPRTLA